ncbi:hypothetical protein C8R44DRAFT_735326 [Mycena epipterygia]|nr:hypothetical protein C8R44DRAFT_735326 [Mycena epipterygia]
MAALYLHNSIWVPDVAESPQGHSPHTRTISSATLQTLPISDQSHTTQPLLHSSTSESVAYLDLLSRQPTHPNAPRGSTPGLSFGGDPTTMRERKGYTDRIVRRRLRRLKAMMAVLEVIMVCWALYTTVRYFLAFAVYQSSTGQVVALVLATVGSVSFAVLFATAVIPFLQLYLLGRNISIDALLTVRMVLRYISSVLLLGPAVVNFALVFAWRSSSDVALDMGKRCDVDIDVVWSIRSHQSCPIPSWGAWLALSIARLLVTLAVLTIYHISIASYRHVRRPSRHRHNASSTSESTYFGSPPVSLSGTPLPSTSGHHHQISSSTIGSNSRPALDRRSLRSSRASSLQRQSPATQDNLRLPRMSSDSPRSSEDDEEFNPYANLPPLPAPATPAPQSENDRELYSFVDRFRSLVSQITREAEDAAYIGAGSGSDAGSSPSETSFLSHTPTPFVGYDESGRPYPPDEHVRILNSYIRRMPTIESIGSREMAGTSVAASSLYHEQLASLHSLSRPPTRAMTDRAAGSEPPSRAGSLSLAAVELINAMGPDGVVDLGELVDRVRRNGSVGSTSSHYSAAGSSSYYSAAGTGTGPGTGSTSAGTNASGVSYFPNGSPMHTPIVEEPLEGLENLLPPPPPPALRPLPRPPSLPRADSV